MGRGIDLRNGNENVVHAIYLDFMVVTNDSHARVVVIRGILGAR